MKRNGILNFELCTDSLEGAIKASLYGFKSIELCSSLSAGGLTPNFGLIKKCVEDSDVEVHVMIRHREGRFLADIEDLSLMKYDIEAAKQAGATGVVFGILNEKNEVDGRNEILAEFAKSLDLKTTFHRAFDFVPDFRVAVKEVLKIGFDRLLTSGLQPKAEMGVSVISEIHQNFGKEIQVIAGSGISPKNALKFSASGIDYLHFTARKPQDNPLKMDMGQVYETDVRKIQQILNLPFNHIN